MSLAATKNTNEESGRHGDSWQLNDVLETVRRTLEETCGLQKPQSVRIITSSETLLNIVVKILIETDDEVIPLFVKIEHYPNSRSSLKEEYDNIQQIREILQPDLDSVEPVTFIPGPPGVLVLRECPGERLHDQIRRTCGWRSRARNLAATQQSAAACGRWLRGLEQKSRRAQNSQSVAEALDKMTRIRIDRIRSLNALDSALPVAETCRTIIDKFDSSSLRDEDVYFAHGDFHPENLFNQDEDRVSVIDFQLAQPRWVGYDALYFRQTLLLSYGPRRFRPQRIQTVMQSFFEGYGRMPEPLTPLQQLIRAEVVLQGLVFLSTISSSGGTVRKLASRIDLRKLRKWLG